VTSEVLPQIRKTGGYIPTKDESGRQLSDLEIMARALQIQQRTIATQKEQIADLTPKANYCDEVLGSVSCFTTTQIAKELSMTVHVHPGCISASQTREMPVSMRKARDYNK
jgi:anti-repressor protein